MELFIQQLANGLTLGAIYAVFGLGFGLIFATLGILNVAYGAYATVSTLVALWVSETWGLPFVLALLTSMLVGALVALLVDQIGFEPVRRRGSDLLPALITSVAFWIIFGAVARVATGGQSKRFPAGSVPEHLYDFGVFSLTWIQVASFVVAVVIGVSMHLAMTKTPLGSAMRAVGYNRESASIAGVNPKMVILVTASVAGALAGLSGVLAGVSTSNVSYLLGESLLLKGLAAVIVGGFGDVRGTVIGGFLIGACEVLAGQYIAGSFRDAVTFGLLIIFLVLRPRGIFGPRVAAGRP
jgi:branched-chain amino acid transport system permease protein